MKLDRIHQIAEIIASVAIVASLIFVGVQVSQNTNAMEQQLRQSAMETWNEISFSMASNDSLADQFDQSIYPVYRNNSNTQLRMWVAAQLNTIEDQYLLFLDGRLSTEIWTGYEAGLLDLFRVSSVHNDYWQYGRTYHSPRFQNFIDDLISVAAQQRQKHLDAAAAQ